MRVVKPKKKSLLLRVALLALAIYIVVSLVQLQLQFDAKEREHEAKCAQLEKQLEINRVLLNEVENSDAYLEQQARKQGMAKPGETILIEIPSE